MRRCALAIATVGHGRPNLIMDHLQLGLRHDAPRGGGSKPDAGGAEPEPHFYLSLYVIPWSRELGAGHVALLRHRGPGASGADMILTDNPSLGRAQQANLRSVGYSRVDLTSEPRPASFVRSPIRDQDHVRYQISAAGLGVDARWDDLGEAIFAYGPAPQKSSSQRIWSTLFEAGRASAVVDGVAVAGHTYAVETWVPWLGRSLSSAHVARGEILVDDDPV